MRHHKAGLRRLLPARSSVIYAPKQNWKTLHSQMHIMPGLGDSDSYIHPANGKPLGAPVPQMRGHKTGILGWPVPRGPVFCKNITITIIIIIIIIIIHQAANHEIRDFSFLPQKYTLLGVSFRHVTSLRHVRWIVQGKTPSHAFACHGGIKM